MKMTKIKCPRCGTQTTWQENPSRPFCSEKCRLIDLGRWASEDYSIAARENAAPWEDTGE